MAALAFFILGGNCAFASDEDDEEDGPAFAPGLVGAYTASDGTAFARRDDTVGFAWRGVSPDERLPRGEFSVGWRGRLFTMAPGDYRFYLYLAGAATMKIADQQVLEARSGEPKWFESPPVQLEYGYHSLEITFHKTSDAARIGLYWSGPKFGLEPLPHSALWHEPAEDPGERFERGGELWRALRCANCHRDHGDERNSDRTTTAAMAPELTRLSGNLSRRWLVDWLARAEHRADQAAASPVRMPSFGISQDEAVAIAAYLLAAERAADASRVDKRETSIGAPNRGQRLLLTLGCLSCHQVGNLGTAGLFGGGDLTHIAEKRPPDFFARWLENPAAINAAHRMPVFRLSSSERADLAAHLATLGDQSPAEDDKAPAASLAARGQQLINELRCGACHRLPNATGNVAVAIATDAGQNGCLGLPDRARGRPGYELSTSDRDALTTYLGQRRSPPVADGKLVLRQRNCLGCHARDAAPGISDRLPKLVEAHAELASLTPTLSAPSLTQVGDKLHDAALADAIALRGPPLRPWLAVRMPRFDLSAGERQAIIEHFATVDRIPEIPATKQPANDKSLLAAGGRLVTSAGFGCTSCHQIGHSLPKGVSLAAHGPDLSRVGRRIRRAWFDRWVHNPARIVPRIEMPAIQIAAPGVLGGRLDDQLAAVWHVLNLPGFEPPSAGPIRIARHRGGAAPAEIITDVVEIDGRVLVRPAIVGLANRQNVLFDLKSNQLSAWWTGDIARQYTRGKGWYWEPAGKNIFSANSLGGGELTIDQPATRAVDAEFDRWAHLAGGVRLDYRLTFADDRQPLTLLIEQEFTAADRGDWHGFRRRWQIRNLPAGHAARLQLTPPGVALLGSEDEIAAASDDVRSLVAITTPGIDVHRTVDEGGYAVLESRGVEAPIVCEAVYLARAAADPPAADAPSAALPVARLAVVPGYEAVRLPLPRDEMPTGLAWRNDGALAFCSLKGGVWLARDTDGDGLEDHLQNFADGLPAPYGIAVHGEALDVCAKYGVVRLTDADADGHADRGEIVASGWGYTADYHDWAIGLPSDAAGNYYLALPCQQDDRSPDEAYLRGTAVKLVPREPSPAQPRRYALQPMAAGLRFPMGLVLDRTGALFATDNQGNYTPFNELNHLVAGARYGFINKLEAKTGLQPSFIEPAVSIPHPWTRSVNGICFLNTPEPVRRTRGDVFGPFEGQLLGCEYDTRRLIRLSLEKIGDTYQGAAYPFSIDPTPGAETFEGPVVCAVSPAGDVYLGNLRDSGWGGGQNTGSLVRLRPKGEVPLGLAEVRAESDGFSIRFTGQVAPDKARAVKNYSISSYRRIATPAYGGPDVDRADETIVSVELSSDTRSARLRLARLRPGFVYELRVANLARSNQTFFPAEAYYTLRETMP